MNKNPVFPLALTFVLKSEGGYSNNPADSGGMTYKGITQGTYNSYRKSKHLPIQPIGIETKSHPIGGVYVFYKPKNVYVKINITDAEISDIYYNNYFLASGCNGLTAKLAVVVFDTAVNMGIGRAEQFLKACNGSVDKFLELRKSKYEEFARVSPKNAVFLKGWLNRVEALKKYLELVH